MRVNFMADRVHERTSLFEIFSHCSLCSSTKIPSQHEKKPDVARIAPFISAARYTISPLFYFLAKTYVVGTQNNRLNEKVLLSFQNICLN